MLDVVVCVLVLPEALNFFPKLFASSVNLQICVVCPDAVVLAGDGSTERRCSSRIRCWWDRLAYRSYCHLGRLLRRLLLLLLSFMSCFFLLRNFLVRDLLLSRRGFTRLC
jgi:hypothetical protein